MTQEQKQFIIKALETGIPALAQEHIAAVEEVAKIAAANQEDINGQEAWQFLNEARHDVIIKTIRISFPFMANDLLNAYYSAINAAQAKFDRNIQAKKEQTEAEQPTAKSKKANSK